MSVKFEKETIKNTPIPGGKKHEIAHEIGERLTGGEGGAAGYLAVCDPLAFADAATTAVPAAATEESTSD
ncbi:MAG: hypothetical protein Q9169_008682 [Polycauliona sp. 2 TL-2023]